MTPYIICILVLKKLIICVTLSKGDINLAIAEDICIAVIF